MRKPGDHVCGLDILKALARFARRAVHAFVFEARARLHVGQSAGM